MRLIDADAIPYTMLYKENWMTGTGKEAQGVWKSEIDKMPTVEERKTGKWISHGQYADFFPHKEYRCSECDTPYLEIEMYYKYCPNCGAKME